MVLCYDCESCKLHFQLGWYHGERGRGEYLSENLMVCKACGVVHGFECSEPRPTFFQKLFRVKMARTYRLKSHAKPIIDPTFDVPAPNIVMDGWAGESVIDEKPVAELSCAQCHQKGALIDHWPEGGASCPNCRDAVIVKSGRRWMT